MTQYVFLDLDGTLSDPMLGITNAVMYALRRLGIEENDRNSLIRFIGPPLIDSFMSFYGFTLEQATKALQIYREYYSQTGIFENKLYPGCEAFLSGLCKGGKSLILASSKPEKYVKQILDHFNLSRYFSFIGGSDMEETRAQKADVIAYCLQNIGMPPVEKCVMVGDRKHDVIGAGHHKMKCIGVLYGFGSKAELKSAGADMLAKDFIELSQILLSL